MAVSAVGKCSSALKGVWVVHPCLRTVTKIAGFEFVFSKRNIHFILKAVFPIFSMGPGAILTLITFPDDWSSPQLSACSLYLATDDVSK